MYISSTSSWPIISTYSTQSSNSTSTSSDIQTSENTKHKKTASSIMDSDSAQIFFNGTMSQGLLPVADNSSNGDEIANFLDKVKSGTVTASDLSSMQDVLSKITVQSDTTPSSTTSASATSNNSLSLKDFLDKVKDGTVTDADLSTMQSELAAQQGVFAGMQPPPPPPLDSSSSDNSSQVDTSSSIGSGLVSFLDKVKNGTVTESDLSSIQALLTSDTTQSSTASATSDSHLSLKAFLDKVKDGTVTDSDLSTMQSELAAQQGESGTMPPPMMGSMDHSAAKNNASSQNAAYISQQLLTLAMQAYDGNTSASDWNTSKNSYTV